MIFNPFSQKSKLGIDIGTASIKIIELGKKGGRFELLNYGIFELKGVKGTSDDRSRFGENLDRNILKLPNQEIVWGIKEVIKKAGIQTKDVIASIPSFSTFATVIDMPYISEEDLAKAIPFEARKYIPIPINEVVVDWSIIGIKNKKREDGVAKKSSSIPAQTIVEVFLAAVPKDETSRYQSIMKDAGLNLRALELENSALIRGLLGNDLSTTAIVNIGGRSTSIMIIDGGYERLSHSYEVGGFEITKSISRSLNISLQKAEELKKKFGFKETNENIVREAMISLVDMMIFETKKTIGNYEEMHDKKVTRIILTGGLSHMPNFLDYFKKKLNRDVFFGNVFSRIIYDKNLTDAIPELGSIFSVSAGLAMRDI